MAVPTFVAASSASINTAGTTVTCTYPAGSVSGDLLVMYAGFQRSPSSASTYTLATPSGWTLLDSNFANSGTGVGMASASYYRFRGAETSVSVVASNSSNMFGTVQIHAYTGDVDQTTPINTSDILYNSTVGTSITRVCPSVTTTVIDCAVSLFMDVERTTTGGSTTWAAGATERTDGYSGTGGDILFSSATATKPTAGATGTYTFTAAGLCNQALMATVAVQPSQVATIYATEDISLTEDAYVQAGVFADDSAALTDDATLQVTADPDQITLSETAYVQATAPADDTITLSETAYVEADVFADDTITFSEDAYVSNSIQTTEDITLTEADSTVGITDNDSISWSETAFIEAEAYATEDISVSEDAWVTITVDPDGIVVTDDAKVGIAADDSVALTETAGIAVHVFATDDITVTEDAGLSVYADDDVTVTENAIRLISGLLQFPRQVKIEKDNRRIIIDREPRRVSIDPDYRRTSIRAEVRRHIVIPKDKRIFTIEGE